MPPPPKVIVHGQGSIASRVNVRQRLQSPDEGTLTYRDCPSLTFFTKGKAPPGFPGLRILDVDGEKKPAPAGLECWDLTLSVRGLLNGTDRVIKRSWNLTASGWDECTEVHYLLQGGTVPDFGTAMAGYANMRLMRVGEEQQLDDYFCTRAFTYQGIRTGKLVLRSVGANENITTPSDPIVVDLTGGWTDPARASISFPRVTCEDVMTDAVGPATDALPGAVTPTSAPPVQSFSLSGTLVKNWPHGWKLSATPGTELYRGAGLWNYRNQFEYAPAVQFG